MIKGFEGKNAFITGGSSGIGLSAARELAARGADISIFARSEERLKRALDEIRRCSRREGQRFSSMQIDVSDHENVGGVMKEAVERCGPPDLLINCAGRARPHYFEEISYEQFDETMKTNLYGIWNTVSALAPVMKKKGGHIVNVASMAGFVGVFGYTDYCASKYGVVGLSEVLRSELKRWGIGVSVLCPPDTDTPGFATENRTKPEETKAASGGAKLMAPDDVARQLISGLEKGKFMIIPGFEGKLTWRLKRFLPALVEAVLSSQIRKVQRDLKSGLSEEI